MSDQSSQTGTALEMEASARVARTDAPRTARKPKKKTKADALVALLTRTRGATLDDMMKATGWQAHSVRGFLAGSLKKKLGRGVTSDVTDKGRVYRIAPVAS